VPRVPVSLMASVVPKHSDNGRRSVCRRFDRLVAEFLTSAAGEFRTDSGDELNGARLLQLAGLDVSRRSSAPRNGWPRRAEVERDSRSWLSCRLVAGARLREVSV